MRTGLRLLYFSLLCLPCSPAQADQKVSNLATFGDKATVSVVSESKSTNGSRDPLVAARAFIDQHAAALKVSAPSKSLRPTSVNTDSLQTSHVHFRQEENSVPVWGAELVVHLDKDSNVTAATGSVSKLGAITTIPQLTETQAVAQARADWIAEFGEDDAQLKSIRLYVVDQTLIDKNAAPKLHLAWEVQLTGLTAARSFHYLVDAQSGEILGRFSAIRSLNRIIVDCSAGAPGIFNDGVCRADQAVPGTSFVLGRSEGMPPRGANPIYSSDSFDTDFIYSRVGLAHNYFLSQFGRDGANFSGGTGTTPANVSKTHAASYAGDGINDPRFQIGFCPNANWDPDRERLSFCKGMPTMDIVGHEYTHAVEHFSVRDAFGDPSGFIFLNEAGALSEGFSDVFGEAMERFAYGNNDWNLGSSDGVTTPILRNLANPESMNLPSTTYSPSYFCGSLDGGGIHTNNVIVAHAAYLLANGGELSGCIIDGIGPQNQEAIFYRALSTYLSQTSGFAAAYTALINSCNDLFPGNSSECLQTRRTLNAVMMNQPGRCSGIPAAPVDCLDPSDLCPLNPNKRAPGMCGCADEIDNDSNGVLDCLPAAEFRADVNTLYKRLQKLTLTAATPKKQAARIAIRRDITRILKELTAAVATSEEQIQVSSTDLTLVNLYSSLKQSVRSALKADARNFIGRKSKAKKNASTLLNVLL